MFASAYMGRKVAQPLQMLLLRRANRLRPRANALMPEVEALEKDPFSAHVRSGEH